MKLQLIAEVSLSKYTRIYNEDSKEGLFRHVLIRTGHKSGEIMIGTWLTYFFFEKQLCKSAIENPP